MGHESINIILYLILNNANNVMSNNNEYHSVEFRLSINAPKIYMFKLNERQYLVAMKED
jgi:hypothetical protein